MLNIKALVGMKFFLQEKSINYQYSNFSLLERNLDQYGVHALCLGRFFMKKMSWPTCRCHKFKTCFCGNDSANMTMQISFKVAKHLMNFMILIMEILDEILRIIQYYFVVNEFHTQVMHLFQNDSVFKKHIHSLNFLKFQKLKYEQNQNSELKSNFQCKVNLH